MISDDASSTDQPSQATTEPAFDSRRFWTIPNILCLIRLAGSPVLLTLAAVDWRIPFLCTLVTLVMTDWFDGKLARWLHQRTEFGARLDSVADVTLNFTIMLSACFLEWDFIVGHWYWIIALIISYAISCLMSLKKFGRLPSYHTRSAKIGWFMTSLSAFMIFAHLPYASLAFVTAMIIAILANIEGVLLTIMLNEWRADVASVIGILRRKKKELSTSK